MGSLGRFAPSPSVGRALAALSVAITVRNGLGGRHKCHEFSFGGAKLFGAGWFPMMHSQLSAAIRRSPTAYLPIIWTGATATPPHRCCLSLVGSYVGASVGSSGPRMLASVEDHRRHTGVKAQLAERSICMASGGSSQPNVRRLPVSNPWFRNSAGRAGCVGLSSSGTAGRPSASARRAAGCRIQWACRLDDRGRR
jgi:hypothetical protein